MFVIILLPIVSRFKNSNNAVTIISRLLICNVLYISFVSYFDFKYTHKIQSSAFIFLLFLLYQTLIDNSIYKQLIK